MAKTTYSKLGVKQNTKVKTLTFNGQEINVLQYLPIKDKNDLIQITIQQADEGDIINELILAAYFYLNIVYLYTDISFTENQRKEPLKLYDALYSSGLMQQIVDLLPKSEHTTLFENLTMQVHETNEYRRTAGYTIAQGINTVLSGLGDNIKQNAEALSDIDLSKMEEVIKLAKEAGIDYQ